MLGYTKEHTWVRVDAGEAVIGITNYAQQQLGDIVYVDLPKVGTPIERDKPMGTVESVKSVSDLIAPVTGTVLETNAALVEAPEKLNQDPEGTAWMAKVKLSASEVAGLLDAAAYAAFVKAER